MPTVLTQLPFEKDLLPVVQGFSCGEEHFWEREINEWIAADPATKDGALYALSRPKWETQVWLYFDEHHELVGYSALGKSSWPDPNQDPIDPKVVEPISIIPAVGIQQRFQGCPRDAEPAERYSTKIMNHLVHEARRCSGRLPFIGLYVHPDNEKAIRAYQRCNFEIFPAMTYQHATAGVVYTGMILELYRYPGKVEE